MNINEIMLKGIPSYCTASKAVLRAVLRRAATNNQPVLVEATANQINQFGGYTGMQPKDYREMVLKLAEQVSCPPQLVIFGGDHLGPLVWNNLPEQEAMSRAETLVRLFAASGYSKLHLDTSMRLADDSQDQALSDEIIARRGATLYAAAMEGYGEALKKEPELPRPVFIIGSEVPIPGGTQVQEESISVTKLEALHATLDAYRDAFTAAGFGEGMRDVIAVVVQPGVEFGSDEVHVYNRAAAEKLTAGIKELKGSIVLEGHSTDYQPKEALREMVADGIKILKVGPALTFAYRDALFALSEMERILVPTEERADLPGVLESTMCASPADWQHHYSGSSDEMLLLRKYSLSDRSRYYFSKPEIQAAEEKLFSNLEKMHIPLGLLYQYMPQQFNEVVSGRLKAEPRLLAEYAVELVAKDYEYAVL
ncbi:MAG: class II D-tagatose-bisphosphate aldolase, non-catalytic subunit [Oscillospiraceae bacterium]